MSVSPSVVQPLDALVVNQNKWPNASLTNITVNCVASGIDVSTYPVPVQSYLVVNQDTTSKLKTIVIED